MKTEKEIKQGLKDMEIRRKGYILDMCSPQTPNGIVYNTDIIRKMEVTDATIHTLKWVLHTNKPAKKKKGE
jgi:hypothetical protein